MLPYPLLKHYLLNLEKQSKLTGKMLVVEPPYELRLSHTVLANIITVLI